MLIWYQNYILWRTTVFSGNFAGLVWGNMSTFFSAIYIQRKNLHKNHLFFSFEYTNLVRYSIWTTLIVRTIKIKHFTIFSWHVKASEHFCSKFNHLKILAKWKHIFLIYGYEMLISGECVGQNIFMYLHLPSKKWDIKILAMNMRH